MILQGTIGSDPAFR